jgi:hypothetical protein
MKLWPSLLGMTFAAPSKRSFRRFPTSRNGGILRQQVRIAQDPDSPWHLQSVLIKFFTAWNSEFQKESETYFLK